MEKMLTRLDQEGFPQVYEIMKQSFPEVEIRAYQGAYQLLNSPDYQILILENNQSIEGFIAAWEFEQFRFVEHFAVSTSTRGAGMGSRMIKEYLTQSQKPVLIEVEENETPDGKRRIAFYRRLGFSLSEFGYRQPALQEGTQEIDLRIMSYPSPITEAAFLHFKKEVFSRVYLVP